MTPRRTLGLVLLLTLLAAPLPGCGPKAPPTTGPDAPKAPGVPPNGP